MKAWLDRNLNIFFLILDLLSNVTLWISFITKNQRHAACEVYNNTTVRIT